MRIGLRGLRRTGLVLLSVVTAAVIAACGGASSGNSSVSPSSGKAKVIKVAYGSTYVFDTATLTNKWWSQVAKQFEAENPGIKVQLVPIPGSYNDIVNKLSLLYRSPSTAPDVAEIPTGQIGLWQSSGYLRTLDSYLPQHELVEQVPRGGAERGPVQRSHLRRRSGRERQRAALQQADVPEGRAPRSVEAEDLE